MTAGNTGKQQGTTENSGEMQETAESSRVHEEHRKSADVGSAPSAHVIVFLKMKGKTLILHQHSYFENSDKSGRLESTSSVIYRTKSP